MSGRSGQVFTPSHTRGPAIPPVFAQEVVERENFQRCDDIHVARCRALGGFSRARTRKEQAA